MDRRIKILIVDDSSINRQILSMLFDADYEILEADDGTTALQVLSTQTVDVIILDIIMPKMGGLEFLKRIKQDMRYKDISVIISTEAGSTENELQALALGADNFIAKPYNPEIIKYRVKNLVDVYIAKRMMLEKSLLETERMFRSIIDVVPGGIVVFRKKDKYSISYADDKLSQMLGYSGKEVAGLLDTDVFLFICNADREKVRQRIDNHKQSEKTISLSAGLLHKDGSIVEAELNVKAVTEEGGGYLYYAVITNVTLEKERENMLELELSRCQYRSGRDSLTGIYNLECFVRKTAQLIEQHPKETFVVGKWNIDRFKAVNELFGSQMGDQVIRAFANYLKQTYSWLCTYGRMEADHFVTCCPESFLEEHAGEIESLLCGELSWHSLNYPICMHAGFYRVEPGDQDVAIMCDRAGMALQSIKDSYLRRENYFNEQLRETLVREQQMMREADKALQEKRFFVVYQPIVKTVTGEIISAEALVRWKKENGEMVSPGEFIPIFERNGFISKLDMYVWEEVCIYQSGRKQKGKRMIPVSVNLSRVDFYNVNLLKDIKDLLNKYDLDANSLRIEITESAYMDQPQELMTAIRQFRKHGFQVLMDDFGSGYSSLNMLKDVSLDILKIDMRFMESLETSDRAGNILFSIIQMAKAIHMAVIAEGVETANQYKLLVSMDCDYVQGYYFYHPLFAEEFSSRLDEETADIERQKNEKRRTILLVDDVELERKMLCGIIGDEYEILTAAGVDEALEILKKKFSSINLIISDIIMPEKNGFELLRQMKKMMYFNDIPVLMATAYGEYENIKTALSMGALDVVTKPYDPSLLRQRLRNILKISERETAQREIYAIWENVVFSKQLDSLLEGSIAGIGRIKLSRDGKLSIREISYLNERFLYYHQMSMKEALLKKTLSGLLQNTPKSEQASILKMIADADAENQQYIQREYRIEWENGTRKNMLGSFTLQYDRDEILLDLIVVECHACMGYQFDKTVQSISEQLIAGIGMEVWRYYPTDDVIEYYHKLQDGKYVRKVIRNGRENTVKNPVFLDKDKKQIDHIYRKILDGENRVQTELSIRSQNMEAGAPRWIRLTLFRIETQGEQNEVVLGMAEDITEEKRSRKVRWRERQYREIFSKNAEFFAEADLTDNCFVSEESLKLPSHLGIHGEVSYDEVLEVFLKTVCKEDTEHCRSMLDRLRLAKWYEEDTHEVKFDFLSNANESHLYEWYTSSMYLIKNEEDGHIYASWQIKNIQHEKQRSNNIRRMAERDTLTGLYNRVMIEKSMDMTLATVNPPNTLSAFLMIDVDNFKAVNDNFGHDFGDSMLRAIAKLLMQTFRPEDVLARIGGDEFAVFVPCAASKEWIIRRAQEVCENSFMELDNQGSAIYVSCSAGIVFAGENGKSFRELYPKADTALYQAKKAGKNRCAIYKKPISE